MTRQAFEEDGPKRFTISTVSTAVLKTKVLFHAVCHLNIFVISFCKDVGSVWCASNTPSASIGNGQTTSQKMWQIETGQKHKVCVGM